jgi:hypothetical protein
MLTLAIIDQYLAEHAQLEACKFRRPVHLGQLIGLRIRYGLTIEDINLSVRPS